MRSITCINVSTRNQPNGIEIVQAIVGTKVQPALPNSYERLCYATGHARFTLGLRNRADLTGAQGLGKAQLDRAIGVVYRPETERASHYFQAILPQQFDEYIWFDDTRAVTPFDVAELAGLPDTYPFGM